MPTCKKSLVVIIFLNQVIICYSQEWLIWAVIHIIYATYQILRIDSNISGPSHLTKKIILNLSLLH